MADGCVQVLTMPPLDDQLWVNCTAVASTDQCLWNICSAVEMYCWGCQPSMFFEWWRAGRVRECPSLVSVVENA